MTQNEQANDVVVTAVLPTASHPRDPHQWALSPAARERLAEDVVGMPVTWNYDPQNVVGRVVGAAVDGDGVMVTLAASPDALSAEQREQLLHSARLGPGLSFRGANDVEVREVSVIPQVDALRVLAKLCRLVLDDMAAATNRDLAADGPVGDEERQVWARIEAAAREGRELL